MSELEIQKYHLHKDEPDKLQFEIFPLKEYLIQKAHNTQKPHVHSFYQVVWFMKGTGKHYVDFNEYDIKDNSLFFISKGQIHHFDDNYQEGCILHFNESFMAYNENFTDVFLKHNIFHSFEKEPVFRIKESDSNELHNIVNQIQTEMWTPNQFAHSDYLKVLLHLFLIVTQRFGIRNNCSALTMNNPSHILFVNFRKLLEENFHKIHTVAEYAGLLNVSTKTLTNCTKEISHQTPLEIINERLILEAKRLLSYSERNVNEVAFELGFEDPSYFVKFFKRHVKMSPREFKVNIA
ncbi:MULTISPECIES: helix-turn-helix domain-containing protein [Draconibacterium]|uniref:helix-turn-helix domain-containing protein n=1 Tax=Draconibacterium TaxID=1471399 RepID=UPI0013D2DEB3|nr:MULTISPECIES: AraC family transcriptional regulator [Draconibacterium]